MALELSGSINISGSMTATTIIVSAPGAPGMVSSSAQITELAPLMAYTASIKGAAIVSSSQQVENYFTFAKTGSANTFYGTQTISGSSLVTGSVGIGTNTIYSGAKLHTLGGILAVEPTNGNTNSEILVGRGLSSLGTSAGSGITSKVNFAFEGSNDNFYQELGFVTTTANLSRINSAADFYISTKAAGASSPTEKLRLTSAGYLRLAQAGIQFNGDTAEANSLDDYEEGTWTPSFAGTTSQSGQAYSTQDGTYTKVGRLVTFQGNIALSTLGTITGFVKINGLPFTALGTPSLKPATTLAYNTNITTIPVSDVYGGNNFMYLYKQSQTGLTSTTQLSQGDLDNTTIWCVSGFYYTA